LALGVAVVTLLILLAVIGASAEHGTAASHLRRGPASVVLSVLFTLADFPASARSRCCLGAGEEEPEEPRRLRAWRHSPVLIAGTALAIFACLTALLALSARGGAFSPWRP